tara:strand:+ start:141 stop:644 length:504 start_codon:yes stop_codon:yes gene_type:complete
MKNITYITIIFVFIFSCSKIETNSPLTIITTNTANISGALYAQLVQDSSNSVDVLEFAPSGTKIYFRIAKCDLNPEASCDEYLIYETTSQAGEYSIDLPVTNSGVDVEISLDDFDYTKTIWTQQFNPNTGQNSWGSSMSYKVYNCNEKTVELHTSINKVENFEYYHN